MFKYCVWYVLKEHHILHRHIKRYSQVFNTQAFPAHITIQHSLEREEAIDVCNRYNELSFFSPTKKPITSAIFVNGKYFHAIEQPVNVNGSLTDGIHISLAYRFENSFNPMELAIILPVDIIHINDIDVRVVDCSSEHPKEWKLLSI